MGVPLFSVICWIFVYQHRYDRSALTLFFKHPSSAPLLLLNIGIIIYIVLLFLYWIYIHAHADSEFKLPILFIDDVSSPLRRFWEIVSLGAVTIVPWFGFIWLWVVFHKQEVWEKESPSNDVGIYQIVSSPASFIGRWNDYRYGNRPDGDSFVPFWQPVLITIYRLNKKNTGLTPVSD